MADDIDQALIGRLLDYVGAGSRHAAVRLVRDLHAAGRSSEAVVHELLIPVQVEVGERWLRGEWTVAVEHEATAIVTAALAELGRNLPEARRGIVVCCPEEERHELAAHLMAKLLEGAGWKVHDLGASTPAEMLGGFAIARDANAVLISCTTAAALPSTARLVAAVHSAGIPVIVGGAAFGHDRSRGDAIGADGWADSAAAADGLLRGGTLVAGSHGSFDTAALARIGKLEAAVPLMVDITMDHLVKQRPLAFALTGPEMDDVRESLDLLIRTAIGATVVADDDLFTEQLDWQLDFFTYRHIPEASLTSALGFLRDWLVDLPASGRLFGLGLEHLEALGVVAAP